MRSGTSRYIIGLCCMIGLISCSTTKYVGEGQYLLDKVKIVTDTPDVKPADMKSYLQQHPNYKIFGLFKWPLYVYNWSGSNEKKWLNKQLRRMGEPPVLLDTTLTEQSVTQLERYMFNHGYTNARVNALTDTVKSKKAVLKYLVKAGEPYRIKTYDSRVDDPTIDSIIHLEAPRYSFLQSIFRSVPKEYNSFIKEDMLFDRVVLDKERQRLTTLLRRRGYYAFNRDYIGYRADSSSLRHYVDLDMYIKPNEYTTQSGETSQRRHRQYYINRIKILTDYDPLNPDATGDEYIVTDSATSRGVKIYYGKEGLSIFVRMYCNKAVT